MKMDSDSCSSSSNDRAILTNLSQVVLAGVVLFIFLYPNPWSVNVIASIIEELGFMLVLISINHDIGFTDFLTESFCSKFFYLWQSNSENSKIRAVTKFHLRFSTAWLAQLKVHAGDVETDLSITGC